jgi:hypothetical protein
MNAVEKPEQVWVKVGEVGVDSGHIIIGDANYVGSMNKDWDARVLPEGGYAKFFGGDSDAGPVWYGMCPGVALVAGHGDGCYPVYARYVTTEQGHRIIAEVKVQFDPHPAMRG